MAESWLDFEYTQPESVTDPIYNAWLVENFPRKADLLRMHEAWQNFPFCPLISLITPVYNPPATFLEQMIESVLAQVYPNWELCLADDASTLPHVREILKTYAARDHRIKVIFRSENGHISACSNSALELAMGEFIGLLDHDDLLAPDALYEVVRLLNQHPEADMIYSDEDKVDEQGKLKEPYFKPDWSPDSFLTRMYICHFGVYRRSLINQIGGFRIGYEGSQDYDLVLRVTEKTENIFHISKILYHWRIHSASVAGSGEAKPYAFIAAEKALNDALVRRGESGIVKRYDVLGFYNVRFEILEHYLVSIIVDAQAVDSLRRCLETTLVGSSYSNYEVIIVDQQFSDESISEILSQLPESENCHFKHLSFNADTSFTCALNQAVQQAKGEFLLFLHDSVEPLTSDWIEALVEQAQRSEIGCVSGLLIYPDHTIRHAGVLLGVEGIAGYVHHRRPEAELGYFGQLVSINNYSALTGACLMCRREKFDQVGGFTEALRAAYYDLDLCLKMVENGLRHVFLPHIKLYYHSAVGHEPHASTPEAINYIQERWKDKLVRDPYYNRNLSLHQSYLLKVDNCPSFNQKVEQDLASDERGLNDDRAFNELAFRLYDLKSVLQEKQEKLELVRDRLRQKNQKIEQLKQELADAQQRIAATETSKFWKLRKSWFKFKKAFYLPSNE